MLVDEGILTQLAQDFHADEAFGEILPLRRPGGVPPASAIVEDVLVHQGDAKLVRSDYALHGHDLSRPDMPF